MRIDILYPHLPPEFDAIGEHTALMARELAHLGHEVAILTRGGENPTPIPAVEIVPTLGSRPSALMWKLPAAVARRRPHWLLIQFNQFSYGRWGVNPFLPAAVAKIRRSRIARVGLLAHECVASGPGFKLRAMCAVQSGQLLWLLRSSAAALFATDEWLVRYSSWAPRAHIGRLIVGSNLPSSALTRIRAKEMLGIPIDVPVVGQFGAVGGVRDVGMMRWAVRKAAEACADVRVVHVGPNPRDFLASVCDLLPDNQILTLDRLDSQSAANAIAAFDIGLAPFVEGVSPRRGSFLAYLQQGVATVATVGALTGPLMNEAARQERFLASPVGNREEFSAAVTRLLIDEGLRARIGEQGREYYEARHRWRNVAEGIIEVLDRATA